ncbi:oligoendopeptidase F [Alicyclobacillus cellulosilyticus]|uniref:Oligopeptidase F n=1 Tax=Alicyclobacillus cellulosilyticus TaxID=1003997 RepID=A0A917K6S4_9BACL|nr:oligoendopeptidase F [Alicyclobacillus cellulosilyticus]GGI99657.1 oligoendopeptidase F [Alicyclobacillus cellulosilyticus]
MDRWLKTEMCAGPAPVAWAEPERAGAYPARLVRAAEDSKAEGGVATAELPLRSEIEDRYKWRLEDMYAVDALWEQDAQRLRQLLQELAAENGRLGESAEHLLRALRLQDQISELIGRLYAYARMRRDEDNTNAKYQALTDSAMKLYVEVQATRAFLEPEILSIPEERLQAFLSACEPLRQYRFLLEELLRQKPHVLSREQEEILAAFGEVTQAPSQIFTMFNNADTRFPKIRDEQGREVEVTHGRYIQFLESRNRDVRKAAFDAVYSTYAKHRNTLAAIYGSSVKKDVVYARLRRYESARQMALDADNVPVSVYDNLIAAVREALPSLHKYLALRKRVLGLDELHMYDLYTPIVGDVDWRMSYEEAVEVVLRAVAPLGEEYVQVAREGLTSGWVDVFENKGKTSGAYSWGTYGVHPYILLNYQGNLHDVFTLAHELGHAMHTYFSHKHQPVTYADYTIFVAEVASTCNEALLMHHLLQNTNDKKRRAYLINHQLEGVRGTLIRQTMFAEFEKLTHEQVEQGGALTPDWLCRTYYDLNRAYFSAVCHVDEDIQLEWARIPHFYNAFYVYKYATGISAATALAQKILTEGEPAVTRYLEFLKSGGSDYPIQLLRKAGVDMESPEPVRATLRQFDALVDELAALLEA